MTGQSEIATAQQRRDAEVSRIKAEGEAIRLQTETDAKNKAILESARVCEFSKKFLYFLFFLNFFSIFFEFFIIYLIFRLKLMLKLSELKPMLCPLN